MLSITKIYAIETLPPIYKCIYSKMFRRILLIFELQHSFVNCILIIGKSLDSSSIESQIVCMIAKFGMHISSRLMF